MKHRHQYPSHWRRITLIAVVSLLVLGGGIGYYFMQDKSRSEANPAVVVSSRTNTIKSTSDSSKNKNNSDNNFPYATSLSDLPDLPMFNFIAGPHYLNAIRFDFKKGKAFFCQADPSPSVDDTHPVNPNKPASPYTPIAQGSIIIRNIPTKSVQIYSYSGGKVREVKVNTQIQVRWNASDKTNLYPLVEGTTENFYLFNSEQGDVSLAVTNYGGNSPDSSIMAEAKLLNLKS